jgi:hypothetical protein
MGPSFVVSPSADFQMFCQISVLELQVILCLQGSSHVLLRGMAEGGPAATGAARSAHQGEL